MKKNLLLVASLFVGAAAFAQFTETNSPADGDGITLFVIDSLAPNFASQTGANATWDYSTYSGYNNEVRNITAVDAANSPNGSSFPNATVSIDMEGFLKTFSGSSATELTGYGFVFEEPSIGELVAKYDTDQAILYSFPMDENSPAITDNFSGTLDYVLGIPQTVAFDGGLEAKVDGKGTLKLADNSYNNVLRYRITDTINTTLMVIGPVQMIRVQYEYYDHAQSSLPIFIHSSIDFTSTGGASLSSSRLVMSLEDPSTFVGLSTNELAKTSVYPVPATDQLNIELPSTVETANVTISDVQGRQVYSTLLNGGKKTIDVSNMNKGMYIVKITSDATSVTKNIIIQ